MSCNCSSPVNPDLPTIAQVNHAEGSCPTDGSVQEAECPSTIQSSSGPGAVLGANLTDARCVMEGEGVTLLARVANRLVRFIGNGFLVARSGQFYLVNSIPLVVTALWNKYWRPDPAMGPVLGDPKDFPYGVIADKNGNLYGIKGHPNKNTLHVWSFERSQWENLSPDQFPIEVSRAIAQSAGIELIGFNPVSVVGNPANVRVLKALSGHGIVYLERTATASVGECPGADITYVAKVLAFPEVVSSSGPETGRHRLVYSSRGLYWEPSQLEVTDGVDGILGN